VEVRKSTLLKSVIRVAEWKFGQDPGTLVARYECCRISGGVVSDYGMEDGDVIDFFIEQVGGKPVIYLYSPSDIDASVNLFLIPEWRFSAIYPTVSTKTDHVEWNVRTHQDGSLTEKNSGLNVSYLFWEAEQVKTYSVSMLY
jgi:hypothetical protein